MSSPPQLVKGLGLWDATMIVTGSMIGSGIFIVSADIARQVGSPGWMLAVWGITAVITIMAALSYGELAALMPKAGGQYVYLREAYGRLFGFLYGWTFFMVIQTGTIAAIAVAFAKFLGVLAPWVSGENYVLNLGKATLFGQAMTLGLSTQQVVAIAVILFLTAINMQGVRLGTLVQNVFTVAKIAALLGLIALGLAFGSKAGEVFTSPTFWTPMVENQVMTPWALLLAVGTAMVGSLFAADAWNNVTFTAGETKDPHKNVPLSLIFGVLIVVGLYLLANLAYLTTLGFAGVANAPDDRVGTAVMQVAFGGLGGALMAIAIMISTFGCNNGMVLTGARVYYAMARDGVFFKQVGQLNRAGVPAAGLILQMIWACILTLSGSWGALLDYVMFAALLFYVLTVGGIFILRRKMPEAERPYKVWGYPWVPIGYMASVSLILVDLLIFKPMYTWPGFIIVLLGVPIYYLVLRKSTPMDEENGEPAAA